MSSASQKIVFVTGASSGLGLETVKTLMQSSQPYRIFLGCLVLEEGEKAILALKGTVPQTESTIKSTQIDLRSDESIASCFERIKADSGYIDVLVNNAGVSLRVADMGMREAWNTCYDINVTGTQIMTHTFAPLLVLSSDPRLIFVTSGLSSLTAISTSYTPTRLPVQAGWPKPEMHPYHAYRPSKTALNMVMLEWHWQLQEDNVKTWCVSPGFLATSIGNSFAGQPGAPPVQHPSIGGKLITSVIEGLRDQDVGKVVTQDGIQPF